MAIPPAWIYVLEDEPSEFDTLALVLQAIAQKNNRPLKVIWMRDLAPIPRDPDIPECFPAPLRLLAEAAGRPGLTGVHWSLVTIASSRGESHRSEVAPPEDIELVPWSHDDGDIAEIRPDEIRPHIVILDRYIADQGDASTSENVFLETADLFHYAHYPDERVITLSKGKLDGKGYGPNVPKGDKEQLTKHLELCLSPNRGFTLPRSKARDFYVKVLKKRSWRTRIAIDRGVCEVCHDFPSELWSDVEPRAELVDGRVLWRLGTYPNDLESDKKNLFYFPPGISGPRLIDYQKGNWFGLTWDFLRCGTKWLAPEEVLFNIARRFHALVFPDTSPVTRPEEVWNAYAFLRMMIGPNDHFTGLNDAIDLGAGATGVSSNKHMKELCPPTPDPWFSENFPNLRSPRARRIHRAR